MTRVSVRNPFNVEWVPNCYIPLLENWRDYLDCKVHGANMGANMGPIWGPSGSHVGPMNFAVWVRTVNLGVYCYATHYVQSNTFALDMTEHIFGLWSWPRDFHWNMITKVHSCVDVLGFQRIHKSLKLKWCNGVILKLLKQYRHLMFAESSKTLNNLAYCISQKLLFSTNGRCFYDWVTAMLYVSKGMGIGLVKYIFTV